MQTNALLFLDTVYLFCNPLTMEGKNGSINKKITYFGQKFLNMKVIGLGNALVDILLQNTREETLRQLDLPKGSMQLIESDKIPVILEASKALTVSKISGGSAANTIHGLARLGTSCAYIGKVGSDNEGDFYDKDLKKAGVETMLFRSKTSTGRAFTFITSDAERTFATYLGAAVDLSPSEITSDSFRNCDILHIEGYLVQNTELIAKAMKLAKDRGMMVSLDLASFNVVETNREFLSRVIPEYADILFANEEEADAYTGMDPESAVTYIAKQVKIAVVKTGKSGSVIRSGNEMLNVGIIPVNAVDTTGAGDQYAAGFLHGFCSGLPLLKCGSLGALLAGRVIENFGARIAEERWPEIYTEVSKIV
jgi:sugar/nucleoside kinase (ribokinase family)